MAIALRHSRLIPSAMSFVAYLAAVTEGALALLDGETDGFAIDATTYPATVAVIDTGTPANDLSNVDLDASNLTQSGTSPKMVHFPDSPYVRWTPLNLFLNSGSPATQNVTLVVDFVYTYGITGSGSLAGSAGASGTATAGSPVTFTATTTTGTFTVSGGPSTMFINRGPTLTSYLATTGAIRIGIPLGYDNAASQYGILVEPAGTNLLLGSQGFGDNPPWQATTSTLTSNAGTAPDGSSTAATHIENTDNSAHSYFYRHDVGFSGVGVTSGTSYTFSQYIKANGRNYVRIDFSDDNFPNDGIVTFDLNGVAVFSSGADIISSSIVAVGDGWLRISVTMTADGSGGAFPVLYLMSDSTTTSYLGDGTSGIYLWGAQFETGTVATSYIPTVAATATRAADDIRAEDSTTPVDATPISWWGAAKVNRAGGSGTVVAFLQNDAANEAIGTYYTTADSSSFKCQAIDGGSLVADIAGPVLPYGTAFNYAMRCATNDVQLAVDGSTFTGDVSATMPSAFDDFMFGSYGPATSSFNGVTWIYYWVGVPRALNDSELQAKTA